MDSVLHYNIYKIRSLECTLTQLNPLDILTSIFLENNFPPSGINIYYVLNFFYRFLIKS